MSTSYEKWQWIQDLTGGREEPPKNNSISCLESDEFEDGELTEEQEAQRGLWGQIANGFEWMREEERVGRWLGLILAILIWGGSFTIFYATHADSGNHYVENQQQNLHTP